MKQKKSFRAKSAIWIYSLSFATITIIAAIICAAIFINLSVDAARRQAVKNYGNEIVELYKRNDIDGIKNTKKKYGVETYIFNIVESNGVQYARIILTTSDFNAGGSFDVNVSEFDGFLNALNESGDGDVLYRPDRSVKFFIYGSAVENETGTTYFYVSGTPVNADMTGVAFMYVLFFALAALLAGCVFSLISAKKFVNPILKISDTARVVSLGKIEANYYAGGYREIEELSEYLNAANKELRQADILLKDLTANVSHDLRTPLTMIKAYAETIRDISGDDKVSRDEHTNIIIDETDRLSMLVNDILQSSRLQSGNAQLKCERLNFSKLVEDCVLHFKILEETKNYTFETNIRPNLMVFADPKRLEQVVYNLVANAINYTGNDNKVMVDVSIKEGKALLQVSDTGKGIEPDLISTVWQKYYRLNRHSKIKGTGLGLSIVKAILDEHSFKYGINSVVNQGTTFWIQLPLLKTAPRPRR